MHVHDSLIEELGGRCRTRLLVPATEHARLGGAGQGPPRQPLRAGPSGAGGRVGRPRTWPPGAWPLPGQWRQLERQLRVRLWKRELQRLADRAVCAITVHRTARHLEVERDRAPAVRGFGIAELTRHAAGELPVIVDLIEQNHHQDQGLERAVRA